MDGETNNVDLSEALTGEGSELGEVDDVCDMKGLADKENTGETDDVELLLALTVEEVRLRTGIPNSRFEKSIE